MTPMQKRDLRYAERVAINLKTFAEGCEEVVNNMCITIADAGDAAKVGKPINDVIDELWEAYENFVDRAKEVAEVVGDIQREENSR